MKISVCSCGALFVPQGKGNEKCENCRAGPKRAHPFRCDIVEIRSDFESPGRCQGYMKGICEICLEYCSNADWRGWKAESVEWWSGVKLLGDL